MTLDIIEIKNNGFLLCQNIDISFDKIFVDPATFKVSLVYLPLSEKTFGDYSIFENELRTQLVKLIFSLPALSSPKTLDFSADLSDGRLSLEDLYSGIKSGKDPNRGSTPIWPPKGNPPQKDVTVRMIAINAPVNIDIDITKDEFVIGRSTSAADGVIPFNKRIGRVHCKVSKREGKVTITRHSIVGEQCV